MYPEPSQTSKMDILAKIIDYIQLLTIFAKCSILGVSQVCEMNVSLIKINKHLVHCDLF